MSTFTSPTARHFVACVVCLLILSAPLRSARAEIKWTGSLALTSDYIQQGISQTQGEPALQGGVRAQFDERWTVGAWASAIDRYHGKGGSTEIDVYAGRAWRLNPEWIASLTATHYFYPNDLPYVNYDYDEVTASLGYRSMAFATVAWSPNYGDASYEGYADDRSTLSYELSANQPILRGWSGNVGVGYRDLSELFDESYWYGHAGLMLSTDRFTVHLTYTYVDRTARELFGHDRAAITWLGTVIWRFGNLH
ncbi:TorF family putative porin [Steroidobacter flavus]|uniref:TorF family putative porin n=1 Tax=Steroidobacter flavus TaxID=1842136 RepID=A0ABV8T190_9GAMM